MLNAFVMVKTKLFLRLWTVFALLLLPKYLVSLFSIIVPAHPTWVAEYLALLHCNLFTLAQDNQV